MAPSALIKKIAAIYRRCGYIVHERGKQPDPEAPNGFRWVLVIKVSRQDEDMPDQQIGAVWMTPHHGTVDFEFVGSRADEIRNVMTTLGLA